MRRWFLPREPNVLGLLRAQVEITIAGMEAFGAWARGNADQAAEVQAAEHRADDAKRALQRELRAAFSTPLDPEDIYELSERLDEVIGGAKDLVREAEVLAVEPDPLLAEMADIVGQGVRHPSRRTRLVCGRQAVMTSAPIRRLLISTPGSEPNAATAAAV